MVRIHVQISRRAHPFSCYPEPKLLIHSKCCIHYSLVLRIVSYFQYNATAILCSISKSLVQLNNITRLMVWRFCPLIHSLDCRQKSKTDSSDRCVNEPAAAIALQLSLIDLLSQETFLEMKFQSSRTKVQWIIKFQGCIHV